MNPSDVLDVTHLSGDLNELELKAAINKAVEKTQSSSIILPLPNLLYLRHDQYDLLQDDPDLQFLYESEDRMYVTPLNCMEIRVK